MSLSASMWSSVSGLLAHGEKMSVVGNNIANLSTVAYKGQRMDFQDMLYQNIGTASGTCQVGAGSKVGIIMNNFSQGTIESTTSVTDIAINGNGFFKVVNASTGESYYTRAGNFYLDKDGYLIDSNNYRVQGWGISSSGLGATGDIIIDTSTCDPSHTTLVGVQVNLATDGGDNSTSATDPFFALLQTWDANQSPALGSGAYSYTTSLTVYDEGGTAHVLTIYFDQVSNDSLSDGNTSETYWEYIITMDPAEDLRDYDSVTSDTTSGTNTVPDSLKGLLGTGTLTFNSTGQLTNMTCFVPQADSTTSGDAWWTTDPTTGEVSVDLSKWVAAPMDSNGLPLICANFSGTPGLSNVYNVETGSTELYANAQDRLIAIDFGLSSGIKSWDYSVTGTGYNGLVSAADIGTSKDNATGMGTSSVRSSTATTSQGTSYQEYNLTQNGYTFGYLSNIAISQNGIISGIYSNGQSLELYQLALYNFQSLQNLQHEGGNLYSETAASGIAVCGTPGTGMFGTTENYSLEQSNVDMTTEFVNMITTQRGFQANSKTVTTVDTMLETVISMKR